MKTKLLKITAFVIGLTFIFSIFPQATAAISWSDDFEDGNYNGWTIDSEITNGVDFLVSGGALYSADESGYWGWINHSSIVTEGTWSFDFYHNGTTVQSNVIVMGNGTADDINGYGIHFNLYGSDIPTISLSKYSGRIGQGVSTLMMYIHDSPINGTWTHFDMTRDASTGEMHLFMNGEHIAEATDLTYDYSELFAFSTGKYYFTYQGGLGIDNIIVDDAITVTTTSTVSTTTETTTTETTTTESTDSTTSSETDVGPLYTLDPMLLILAGGGAVALILVVIVVKRR